MEIDVLYEDNHCIAVNKPAGIAVAHVAGDTISLAACVKDWLKGKYAKPGNVFLGIVHRLDKPTTGVLLFAKTSKGAARLAEQFRGQTLKKTYWAIVDEAPAADTGTLQHWVRHDDAAARVRVVAPTDPGAQQAKAEWRVLARAGNHALMEIALHTGRKHQIRVQFSHAGMPLVGDRKYGGTARADERILLHARSLSFHHVTTHEPITVKAALPPLWRKAYPLLCRVEDAA